MRFSTEAANADRLDEDGTLRGTPQAPSADGTPREETANRPESQNGNGETKPGKDINAAGFVRDKDAAKP
jgi:hypothetical protein